MIPHCLPPHAGSLLARKYRDRERRAHGKLPAKSALASCLTPPTLAAVNPHLPDCHPERSANACERAVKDPEDVHDHQRSGGSV
jgi:hypothetical protein